MEKIKKYETLIIDLLNSIKGASLDNFVIVDKEKRHYQLLYVGNDNRNRYFSQVRIHFYLRDDGVVCLYEIGQKKKLAIRLSRKAFLNLIF